MVMINIKEAASRLAMQAEKVVLHLLPNAKRNKNHLEVGSIQGEIGKSLKVCISGNDAGKFFDHADPSCKGDLVELWRMVNGLNAKDALIQVCDYLGIREPIISKGYKPNAQKTYKKPIPMSEAPLIERNPVYEYLINERCLKPEILEKFKVSFKNRDIVFNFYKNDEIVFYKTRRIDLDYKGKKIITSSKDCEPCLFGWNAISPTTRSLAITEGEIDAMSICQYGLSALSIPGGCSNDKWIENELENLSVYDEIYICFDSDEAGQKGARNIASRLGIERCYLVTLPYKDANECLKNGVTQLEIFRCFGNSISLDPEELKKSSSFTSEIIELFHPESEKKLGYTTPWKKANENITFRPHELTIWCGIAGHGKSQVLGNLCLHWLKEGAKILIASLEIRPELVLGRIIRQAACVETPSKEYISKIIDWFADDRLWIFNLLGIAKTDRLLYVFEYAHKKYGIDVFLIDSFSLLEVCDADLEKQNAFMAKLIDFKNKFRCHVHMVVHPRKLQSENIPPGLLDSKGAGSINQLAENSFTVWRNKPKERAVEILNEGFDLEGRDISALEKKKNEPDVQVFCNKHRFTGWNGTIGLKFDKKSCQYLDKYDLYAKPFIEYSHFVDSPTETLV